MKRRPDAFGSETGAVAIVIAVLVTMMLAFTAIVADVGYLFEVRRQLQSAADAGALAGVQELIKAKTDATITEGAILDVAEVYAIKNDFTSDRDTDEQLVMLGSPDTIVGENYVKVSVEKTMNLFFAKVFGLLNSPVRAQAKAQIAYVTGAKNLVPWGAMIIHPSRITARIGDEAERELSSSGNNLWHGSLTVPATSSTEGYPVTVTVYNGLGYPEASSPAGYVIVRQPSDPITKVSFSPNYAIQGQTLTTTLTVESIGGPPTARFAGRNIAETQWDSVSGNVYSKEVNVPNATNSIEYFPVDVSVGSYSLIDAGVLVVRRSTYPIKNMDVSPSAFVAGSGPAGIDVEMNEFIPGELYDLKVTSGSESGNFAALDFSHIYYPPPDWNMDRGYGNPGGRDYGDWVEGGFPYKIYIGDRMWSKTGNMAGPTDSNLDDRINCDHSYGYWMGLRQGEYHYGASCDRLVHVPIVEKAEEDIAGKSLFQVAAIGAFFIENYDRQNNTANITGRFVNYVLTGSSTTTPPPGTLFNMTARLVRPDQ